jgi:putative ABC transport system permease protein
VHTAWRVGTQFASRILAELKAAARRLSGSRKFAATAVLVTACAVMPTIFLDAVRNAVLPPLPFEESPQLMAVGRPNRVGSLVPTSFPKYQFLRSHVETMELAAFATLKWSASIGAVPEVLWGEAVSDNFFSALRLAPVLGSAFTPAQVDEHAQVVVISHRLWQERLGGAPDVLGRQLTLNGSPFVVVGVMPEGFRGMNRALWAWASMPSIDAWVPVTVAGLAMEPRVAKNLLTGAGSQWLTFFGRLKPGRGRSDAKTEIARISRLSDRAFPVPSVDVPTVFIAESLGRAHMDPKIVWRLNLLRVAALFLAFLAFVNMGNLFLARALDRLSATAIKITLGVPRASLIRVDAFEAVLIGCGGTAIAVCVTALFLYVLASAADADQAVLAGFTIERSGLRLTGQVLTSGFSLAALGALVSGLVPALQTLRVDLSAVLKRQSGVKAFTGIRSLSLHRPRGFLIVAEIALAVALVIPASLLIRSFGTVMSSDRGFDATSVLTAEAPAPRGVDQGLFEDELLGRVRALAGVTHAGVVNCLPVSQMCAATRLATVDDGRNVDVSVNTISSGALEALRMRIIQGRGFDGSERRDSPGVAVVSALLAKQLGQPVLGRRITVGGFVKHGRTAEIIGVVADVQFGDPLAAVQPVVYVASAQAPSPSPMLLVKGEPERIAESVRNVLRMSGQPSVQVALLESRVARSYARFGFIVLLLAAITLVAVILTGVGIYSLVAWSVGNASADLAVRAALGASPDNLRKVLVRAVIHLTSVGLVIGTTAGLFVSSRMRSVMPDIAPWEVTGLLSAAAVAAILAVAAALVPGRRAAGLDPAAILRYQ